MEARKWAEIPSQIWGGPELQGPHRSHLSSRRAAGNGTGEAMAHGGRWVRCPAELGVLHLLSLTCQMTGRVSCP